MDLRRLREVDLNLLTTLRAVIDFRSVSRAAEALGVSQGAVSKALAKLRSILDDDLFIRSAGGIQLTARTTSIRDTVFEITDKAICILNGLEISPSGSPLSISIACDDLVASYVIPRLIKRLGTRICGRAYSLKIEGLRPASYEERIDYFFILHDAAYTEENLPKSLQMTKLGRTKLKIVVRNGHPLLSDFKANIFADYPRVDLSLQYANLSNRVINYKGKQFGFHEGDASLITPFLFTAIQFLRDRDAILMCPLVSTNCLQGTGMQAIQAAKLGIGDDDTHCSIVYWKRDEHSPVHRQFLATLRDCLDRA